MSADAAIRFERAAHGAWLFVVTDKHCSLWPYPAERPENLPHDHCNACVAGKAGQHEAKGQEIRRRDGHEFLVI